MQLFPWFTASSSIKYGKVFIDFETMEKFDPDSDNFMKFSWPDSFCNQFMIEDIHFF